MPIAGLTLLTLLALHWNGNANPRASSTVNLGKSPPETLAFISKMKTLKTSLKELRDVGIDKGPVGTESNRNYALAHKKGHYQGLGGPGGIFCLCFNNNNKKACLKISMQS